MVELPLYDSEGKAIGSLNVDESVFGDKVRRRLLHQVVVLYAGNRYKRTAHTKTRGEVRGSTRKPWPQKHIGRARVGSIRSPIWRGGGVTFGPRARDGRRGLPKRMRHEALRSALLGKLKDKEVSVIESFAVEKPSTKAVSRTLKTIGLERGVLIGVAASNRDLWLSVRNLPKVDVAPVSEWNAYEVLRHRRLLVTRDALEKLGPKDSGWIRDGKGKR